MMKCNMKPFVIDPSSQATEWLKVTMGKEENLEITNVNDDRFFLNLELAVRFGKTLIIQDVKFAQICFSRAQDHYASNKFRQ